MKTGHPSVLPAPSGLTIRFCRASKCLLGLENDLFRLGTQVSTTLQRNSGAAARLAPTHTLGNTNDAWFDKRTFAARLFNDLLQCLCVQLSEQIAFIISSVLSDDTKTNILTVTYPIRVPTALSLWLVHEGSNANSIRFNDSIES